jgi:hypothetical protein
MLWHARFKGILITTAIVGAGITLVLGSALDESTWPAIGAYVSAYSLSTVLFGVVTVGLLKSAPKAAWVRGIAIGAVLSLAIIPYPLLSPLLGIDTLVRAAMDDLLGIESFQYDEFPFILSHIPYGAIVGYGFQRHRYLTASFLVIAPIIMNWWVFGAGLAH